MEWRRPKKLMDQARDLIRLKHYAHRTQQAYVGRIDRPGTSRHEDVITTMVHIHYLNRGGLAVRRPLDSPTTEV